MYSVLSMPPKNAKKGNSPPQKKITNNPKKGKKFGTRTKTITKEKQNEFIRIMNLNPNLSVIMLSLIEV